MVRISAKARNAIERTLKRWNALDYHAEQARLWTSPARFKVVAAGRRSGKTELAKRNAVIGAVGNTRMFYDYPHWTVMGAPTRPQAKNLYWQEILNLIPSQLIDDVNKTDLTITLWNGAQISVVGLEAALRHEGRPIDRLFIDEFASVKAEIWKTNLRPALSTKGRLGTAWLYGVPRGGRGGHFHQVYVDARKPDMPDWDTFHWISSDIIDPEEVEAAKRDNDPKTYAQEYEATFTSFAGRAYYCFDATVHAIEELAYIPYLPLILSFDFNKSPGVCSIMQEQVYKGGRPDIAPAITAVIDEVWIPVDSNTRRVCEAIARKYPQHDNEVRLYGDPAGGVAGTSSYDGSDWETIIPTMRRQFGDRVKDYVPRAQPKQRPRVNATNLRLLDTSGQVHMLVDPVKAPHTADDLDSVICLEGTNGEIDKDHDSNLTHLSDAIGYYMLETHPGEGAAQGWRQDALQ